MPKKISQNENLNTNHEIILPEDASVDVSVKATNSLRDIVAEVKKRAFAKKIVTITSNDVRDNHSTSAIYATCENEYFSIARVIPLNTPVEIEQCLIDTLKEIRIPLYADETKNGSTTGNVKVESVAKYSVSVE